jgi:hypothetical protein
MQAASRLPDHVSFGHVPSVLERGNYLIANRR